MSLRVGCDLGCLVAVLPLQRAETAPVPPETAVGRYMIIRLGDDPDTRRPRTFVVDPGTAQMCRPAAFNQMHA